MPITKPPVPARETFDKVMSGMKHCRRQPARWFICTDRIAEELRKLGAPMHLRIHKRL